MKLPGPDYPITITPNPKRVRVIVGSQIIADTTYALQLQEASYPAVLYIPRGDARMDFFTKTGKASHCPYKGDASYYSVAAGGKAAENAAWSYETPFPAMAEIKEYLAFYASRIDAIEEE